MPEPKLPSRGDRFKWKEGDLVKVSDAPVGPATFMLIDGKRLLRNFPDEPDNWYLLGEDGKWREAPTTANRYVFQGEAGGELIDAAHAAGVAAKLGSSLDDFRK